MTRAGFARHAAVLLVAAIAVVLYGVRLGGAGPLWDENYYLTSTARYEAGRVQFASHPPLGLMLIAAGDRLSGLNRTVDTRALAAAPTVAAAGGVPAGYDMAGPRLASALFACLCAAALFALLRAILGDAVRALLLTAPFLFDTALLVHLRAAHLDAFQLLFAIGALAALLRAPRPWAGLLFGLGVGAAAMVRLNAVLLLPAGLLLLAGPRPLRAAAGVAAGGSAAVLAVLAASLLAAHDPPIPGHARFVSPAVADYHAGHRPLEPAVLWTAAGDQMRFIAADARGIPRSDPNAATVVDRLTGGGAITYRWDAAQGRTAFATLAPNRAAWLLSLAGVLAALAACRRRVPERPAMITLIAAWTALTAGHALLATTRVMYLYHGFLPFLLGLVLLALALRTIGPSRAADRALGSAVCAVVAIFLLQAPLALHRPLTPDACRVRSVLLDRMDCDPAASRSDG